jgi:hypothetical protein
MGETGHATNGHGSLKSDGRVGCAAVAAPACRRSLTPGPVPDHAAQDNFAVVESGAPTPEKNNENHAACDSRALTFTVPCLDSHRSSPILPTPAHLPASAHAETSRNGPNPGPFARAAP